MTNRIDRLAADGLVERLPDPNDRRGVHVRLTPRGKTVVDAALADLLERERELLAGLTERQRATLATLLRTLVTPFDNDEWVRFDARKLGAYDFTGTSYEATAIYESQSRAAIPDDLQRALDAHPAARAFFATLDSANRYAILYRLQDAKRPGTRARRLAQYVAMLEEGKKLHP